MNPIVPSLLLILLVFVAAIWRGTRDGLTYPSGGTKCRVDTPTRNQSSVTDAVRREGKG